MTLNQRAVWTIVFLVAGLAVLSGTMLWGLRGLRRDVRTTFFEYSESRMIHGADLVVAAAEALLSAENPDYEAAIGRLRSALRQLDDFLLYQEHEAHSRVDPRHEELERRRAVRAIDGLRAVAVQAEEAHQNDPDPSGSARVVVALSEVLENLDHLTRVLDTAATSAQDAANVKFRSTITIVALLCLAIIVVTLLISISQYRSVVRPVQILREGVRRISSGKFTEQIAAVGGEEFVELTEDFNRMAAELNELYRTLESRVAEKTKELVRSESLASVGFLAAGMAHEINNPLNIISGYAELSLKQLRKGACEAEVAGTQHALQIIRDEAFRCKEIVEKLLSLTRPGDQRRERVSLAHIADDVVAMVSSLGRYRGARIILQLAGPERFTVLANETELKQVLLNLTINALKAVDPQLGEVRIEGERGDGWVELRITDNGCGMTPQTLEHVFEPFFTDHRDHRDDRKGGVGLGLSITHAIVESHGGRITAESDGPGRGSRFMVRLPAAAACLSP